MWLNCANRSDATRRDTPQSHKPHLPKESRLIKKQQNPKNLSKSGRGMSDTILQIRNSGLGYPGILRRFCEGLQH